MALATPDSPALDVKRIAAISLDLDDTLWPIWPTIERAERALHEWLLREAPKTA
jgi:putative hydrolase of the HAD superfamily